MTRNAEPAEFSFELGDAAGAYTRETELEPVPAGTGGAPVATRVRGLAPDHLYHYRLVAHTDRHVVPGADRTFAPRPGTPSPRRPTRPTRPRRERRLDAPLPRDRLLVVLLARAAPRRPAHRGRGRHRADGGENRQSWALARFLPDGSLDPDFGDGGALYPRIGSGPAGARDIEILPDGRFPGRRVRGG